MRIFLFLVLVVVLVLGVILVLNREKFAGLGVRIGTNDIVLLGTTEPEKQVLPTATQVLSNATTLIALPAAPSSILNPPPSPDNNAPAIAPQSVLDNCRVLIHNYAARFGENPVGDNAEITAALRGNNPKQVDFFREDSGIQVNEKNELTDAYGTPFFFHQVSAQDMEIRSAGEDKKFWTFDDQVTR